MARTKITARKNPSPNTPTSSSSSPPSSPFLSCSPSPPPRPTPPKESCKNTFSDYLSSSPDSNPNPTSLNPLSIVLPHLFQRSAPNLCEIPPHLCISFSKPTEAKRRSLHVSAGIRTSKAKHTKPTVFVISDYDDYEPSIPNPTKSSNPLKPCEPSTSSLPTEPSQSIPPNQKRKSMTEIFSSTKLSQPSPTKTTSKPQNLKVKTTITFSQYSVLNLNKKEVVADLFQEGCKNYMSTSLKPICKVFNSISQHSILPHCESHEYVSDNDALVIHHLLNYKRVNLTYIVIQNMVSATNKDYKKNTVPYDMLLSKIFSYFNIPLSSESSTIKISKFSSKNV
uniref:Proline-rich receptor-like protein kinase PERK10 n=1 Tax=Cicer arietinum TaxID=3827 RepID=A0A1S2Z1V6_CICAR|nr:proline-rich receptor-like protein kinase PERK10 [Cicer arietinum]